MPRQIRPILCAGIIFLLWCFFSPAIALPTAGASDYAKATKLLTQGKDFEQAITLLQAAVRANPKNADYHTALGCAYADRATSIRYADGWQYHRPQMDPLPPSFHIYTKDDSKPFTLSDKQAQAQFDELDKEALAEWQAGIALGKNPKERAQAEYTGAWGILVMGTFPFSWYISLDVNPDSRIAVNDFEAATHDDPKNTIYWQSSGYMGSGWKKPAYGYFQHTLAKQPRNPELWYWVCEDDLWNAAIQTGSGSMHEALQAEYRSPLALQAEAALEKAIAQDPSNAFPTYEMASLMLRPTHYEGNSSNYPAGTLAGNDKVDATMVASLTSTDREQANETLALMDKASKAPKCFVPRYDPPVPADLRMAWGYGGTNIYALPAFFLSYLHLRELARDLYGVAIAAIGHDMSMAVRCERSVIQMGNRLIGDWPTLYTSQGQDKIMRVFVGTSICSMGYSGLVRLEQKYGTPAEAKEAQANDDAFKLRQKKYVATVGKNLSSGLYLTY